MNGSPRMRRTAGLDQVAVGGRLEHVAGRPALAPRRSTARCHGPRASGCAARAAGGRSRAPTWRPVRRGIETSSTARSISSRAQAPGPRRRPGLGDYLRSGARVEHQLSGRLERARDRRREGCACSGDRHHSVAPAERDSRATVVPPSRPGVGSRGAPDEQRPLPHALDSDRLTAWMRRDSDAVVAHREHEAAGVLGEADQQHRAPEWRRTLVSASWAMR